MPEKPSELQVLPDVLEYDWQQNRDVEQGA